MMTRRRRCRTPPKQSEDGPWSMSGEQLVCPHPDLRADAQRSNPDGNNPGGSHPASNLSGLAAFSARPAHHAAQ